jgi:hypothetical protein
MCLRREEKPLPGLLLLPVVLQRTLPRLQGKNTRDQAGKEEKKRLARNPSVPSGHYPPPLILHVAGFRVQLYELG